MKDNLNHCFQSVLGSEGGFVDDPADMGGPTRWGVTQKTLCAWRKHPVSVDDVKALTQDEAVAIYGSQYAAPIRFDDLPSGVDLAVFDTSINSGPDRAARLLQQSLGMPEKEVDGVIGLHTLEAVRACKDTYALITRYSAARLDFMRTLTNWGTFGTGWTHRVTRVENDAKAMWAGYAPPPPIAAPGPDAGQAKAGGAIKVTATSSGKVAIANIAATIAAAVVTAGSAASQASGMLQAYADIKIVRYVLLALAVISAAGTFMVALRRARDGKTS